MYVPQSMQYVFLVCARCLYDPCVGEHISWNLVVDDVSLHHARCHTSRTSSRSNELSTLYGKNLCHHPYMVHAKTVRAVFVPLSTSLRQCGGVSEPSRETQTRVRAPFSNGLVKRPFLVAQDDSPLHTSNGTSRELFAPAMSVVCFIGPRSVIVIHG